MGKRKRRKFTDEFKAEAVRLVGESKKGVGQIARDLDLTEAALRRWVEQAAIEEGRNASRANTPSMNTS